MFHAFDVVTNTKGDSLPGFQVLVRDPLTNAVIPIFADDSGTPIFAVSGLTDIALTDSAGNYDFFVPFGTYSLEYRTPEGVSAKTIKNVPFNSGSQGNPGKDGDPGGNVLSTGPAVQLSGQTVDTGTNVVITDSYTAPGDGGAGRWQVEGQAPSSFIETRNIKRTQNNRVTRIPKDEPVSIGRFGIDQFATRDQFLALVDTFDIASREGYTLLGHPDAVYRKDGEVLIEGASFDGQGCVFRAMSDGSQSISVNQLTRTFTKPVRLANFTTLGAATSRTSANGGNGVTIGAPELPHIRGVELRNIYVGSVDGDTTRGHGGAGISIANASRIRAYTVEIANSFADGFHFRDGAIDAEVYGLIVTNSGDDAASVVSYVQFGLLCENILFDRLTAIDCRSRGCAVVGGRNVVYSNPTIRGSAAAAAYIYSEASFNTLGCENVRILGITAEDCVRGSPTTGTNFANGVVMMGGRPGSDTVNNQPFERSVRDCIVTGKIIGAAARASQGIENNSQYVVRSRAELDMSNWSQNIPAALWGGIDGDLALRARNIGGLPLVVGSSMAGRHYVHDLKIDGARIANPPANTNILTTAAANLTELRIERAEFNNSSSNFFNNDAGFDTSKLRYRDIKINGTEVVGKDYVSALASLQNGWSNSSTEPLMLNRIADGDCTLDGVLNGGTGTGGTLLAILPVGYRPKNLEIVVVITGGNIGLVDIRTDGGVIARTALSSDVRFHNIRFLAA